MGNSFCFELNLVFFYLILKFHQFLFLWFGLFGDNGVNFGKNIPTGDDSLLALELNLFFRGLIIPHFFIPNYWFCLLCIGDRDAKMFIIFWFFEFMNFVFFLSIDMFDFVGIIMSMAIFILFLFVHWGIFFLFTTPRMILFMMVFFVMKIWFDSSNITYIYLFLNWLLTDQVGIDFRRIDVVGCLTSFN